MKRPLRSASAASTETAVGKGRGVSRSVRELRKRKNDIIGRDRGTEAEGVDPERGQDRDAMRQMEEDKRWL